MFLFFVFMYCILGAAGRQLQAASGEPRWIALIDEYFNCTEARFEIQGLQALYARGRFLFGETTDLGAECFVQFSGSAELADAVAALPSVLDVDPDQEITAFYAWHLDRSDQAQLPLDSGPFAPWFTGAGQTVYVVDTGVMLDHVEFGGRASMGFDAVRESGDDLNGHGTHVASTAAGAALGLAPAARIVGVKVLDRSGSGGTSDVVRGVLWAASDAQTASVINLSLGGAFSSSMNAAVASAARRHLVVVAAGNSNADACRFSPASASLDSDVICVGASTSTDKRASFSNYGRCISLFGPGTQILGASLRGPSATTVMSGTSMAAPYISGLALQALERHSGDLRSSRAALMDAAARGVMRGDLSQSPNLLGLGIVPAGPPTPPTLSPTRAPTRPEPVLCSPGLCVDFVASNFGPQPWQQQVLSADLAVPPPGRETMCGGAFQSSVFAGKFVLVRRGGCLFFDKVRACEKMGAKGVLIENNVAGEIFAPGYYGAGTTEIPSCMIPLLALAPGPGFVWGPVAPPEKTPPVQQVQCRTLKRRSNCRAAPACRWRSHYQRCVHRM